MSAVNEKDFPSLKSANTAKLNMHSYAAAANAESPMETSRNTSGTRRQLNTTPTKLPPAKKQATETEVSLAAVLAAIKSLDSKVEDFGKQLRENSDMFARITLQVEQNTVGVAECKSTVENLELRFAAMDKENAALKEKLLEAERYKRRWNLRLSGLKEQEGENLREKAEVLLSKILPQWADQIGDVIDTVHRLGRKEEGRTRQVILQFTRRRHRDAVWKVTKDSAVCKEQGLRFAQDFIKEDRLAREELWPKITRARSLGQVAFYRGHIAVINGKNFQEEMARQPEGAQWLSWSLEQVTLILGRRFPSSHIWVVRASHMYLHKFSCYHNFVESNMFGAPEHSPFSADFGAFHHLRALLTNGMKRAKLHLQGEADSIPPGLSLTLVGFSKGCVVLNQMVYELPGARADPQMSDFVKQISDMFWLDGGHPGGGETWVTDKQALRELAASGVSIHAHVTPYEVCDPMRAWVGREHRYFIKMLEEFGACPSKKLHFEDEPPSIENHFRVIQEF